MSFARGLHRLARRRPWRGQLVIDVPSTVQRTATTGCPQIVLVPALRKSTHLLLLIDGAGQIEPFGDTIAQLLRVLMFTGSFVSHEIIRTDLSRPEAVGFQRLSSAGRTDVVLRDLIRPGLDHLCLLISDGVGRAFRTGALGYALRVLPDGTPVIWLHCWERGHWHRTAAGQLPLVQGTVTRPGDPTRVGRVVHIAPFASEGLGAAEGLVQGRRTWGLVTRRLPTSIAEGSDDMAPLCDDWGDRAHRAASGLQSETLALLALAAAVPGWVDLRLLQALGHSLIGGTLSRYHVAEAMSSGFFIRAPGSPESGVRLRFKGDEARNSMLAYLDRSQIGEVLGFLVRQYGAGSSDPLRRDRARDLQIPLHVLMRAMSQDADDQALEDDAVLAGFPILASLLETLGWDCEDVAVLRRVSVSARTVRDSIDAAFQTGTPVVGRITRRIKGGFHVDIGVHAFLPGSQVDVKLPRDWDAFVGLTDRFKVIGVKPGGRNVILSRRAVIEEQRKKLLEQLHVGDIVTGVVTNILDYGCFVDLGGFDGLAYRTEMSWGRAGHPGEMVTVGESIRAKILAIDRDRQRVTLGLKQLTEDPWVSALERYKVGDKVRGRVVRLSEKVVFVEIEPGVEGGVHVSEMSWSARKVKHLSHYYALGDEVEAIVLVIDSEKRRIVLSRKQLEPNPWTLLPSRYPIGSRIRASVGNVTNFGVFVAIEEGIDGLIHVSDLCWSQNIKDPREVHKTGDEIDAVVLNINVEKEHFSLGIKQLTPDPWEDVDVRYPAGAVVNGVVTKVLDYGALVEIEPHVVGLLHFEKLPLTDRFPLGSELRVRVIASDREGRKLSLSVADLGQEE